jgi:hypothetical protein
MTKKNIQRNKSRTDHLGPCAFEVEYRRSLLFVDRDTELNGRAVVEIVDSVKLGTTLFRHPLEQIAHREFGIVTDLIRGERRGEGLAMQDDLRRGGMTDVEHVFLYDVEAVLVYHEVDEANTFLVRGDLCVQVALDIAETASAGATFVSDRSCQGGAHL